MTFSHTIWASQVCSTPHAAVRKSGLFASVISQPFVLSLNASMVNIGAIGFVLDGRKKGDVVNCCGKMPCLRKASLPGSCSSPEQLGMSASRLTHSAPEVLNYYKSAGVSLQKRWQRFGGEQEIGCARNSGPVVPCCRLFNFVFRECAYCTGSCSARKLTVEVDCPLAGGCLGCTPLPRGSEFKWSVTSRHRASPGAMDVSAYPIACSKP